MPFHPLTSVPRYPDAQVFWVQVPLSLQMASSVAATAATEAAERAAMKRLVLSSAVEDERLPKVGLFAWRAAAGHGVWHWEAVVGCSCRRAVLVYVTTCICQQPQTCMKSLVLGSTVEKEC